MRYALLSMTLLMASTAVAQQQQINWNWQVLTNGCYVLDPDRQPSQYCKSLWDSRPVFLTTPHCAGVCDVHATLGLTCRLARAMTQETIGPDHLAETPAVKFADPTIDPGNITRKRWLKCFEWDVCRCRFDQPTGLTKCEILPGSKFYEHGTSFQGDMGGPACMAPTPQTPPQNPPPGYPGDDADHGTNDDEYYVNGYPE